MLEFFAQCRDDHGVPRLQFALLAVSKVGALEEVGVEEQEQGLEQRRVVRARGPGQRRPVEVIEPQRAPFQVDVDERCARQAPPANVNGIIVEEFDGLAYGVVHLVAQAPAAGLDEGDGALRAPARLRDGRTGQIEDVIEAPALAVDRPAHRSAHCRVEDDPALLGVDLDEFQQRVVDVEGDAQALVLPPPADDGVPPPDLEDPVSAVDVEPLTVRRGGGAPRGQDGGVSQRVLGQDHGGESEGTAVRGAVERNGPHARDCPGQRVEVPHFSRGTGLPEVQGEFVDADLDAGAREDPVEDEAQMVSDLLDALVEPLGALVRVGRDEGGAESPPVDDGSVRGVRTGDPEGLPGEGVAHLAGVEGLDAGGVVLGDTPPDRYPADGAAADVEDIGLAEGGGLEAQTVVTEVVLVVCARAGEGHGGVDGGPVHAAAVVHDEQIGQGSVPGEEADVHAARVGVDRVVHEVRQRGGELVVGTDGVGDGRVGRHDLVRDGGDGVHYRSSSPFA